MCKRTHACVYYPPSTTGRRPGVSRSLWECLWHWWRTVRTPSVVGTSVSVRSHAPTINFHLSWPEPFLTVPLLSEIVVHKRKEEGVVGVCTGGQGYYYLHVRSRNTNLPCQRFPCVRLLFSWNGSQVKEEGSRERHKSTGSRVDFVFDSNSFESLSEGRSGVGKSRRRSIYTSPLSPLLGLSHIWVIWRSYKFIFESLSSYNDNDRNDKIMDLGRVRKKCKKYLKYSQVMWNRTSSQVYVD